MEQKHNSLKAGSSSAKLPIHEPGAIRRAWALALSVFVLTAIITMIGCASPSASTGAATVRAAQQATNQTIPPASPTLLPTEATIYVETATVPLIQTVEPTSTLTSIPAVTAESTRNASLTS